VRVVVEVCVFCGLVCDFCEFLVGCVCGYI